LEAILSSFNWSENSRVSHQGRSLSAETLAFEVSDILRAKHRNPHLAWKGT
jgi:hypothetical protein